MTMKRVLLLIPFIAVLVATTWASFAGLGVPTPRIGNYQVMQRERAEELQRQQSVRTGSTHSRSGFSFGGK